MYTYRDSVLFLTWALDFGFTFLLIAILNVVVGAKIFEGSDMFLMFLYFFLFYVATIALCFFVSTFFSSSRTAGIVAVIVFFFGYFIGKSKRAGGGKGGDGVEKSKAQTPLTLIDVPHAKENLFGVQSTRFTSPSFSLPTCSLVDASSALLSFLFCVTLPVMACEGIIVESGEETYSNVSRHIV